MILDSLSGNLNQTRAYIKPLELTSNKGAVYVVCGSSGKLSSSTNRHPVMYYTNTSFLGYMLNRCFW